MNSTQESQEVEVELVDFSKPVTQQQLVEFDYGNYLTSNLSPRGYAKGLKTYTCSCGSHSFAAAWSNDIDNWIRHQRMVPALRKHVEEIAGAPEKPPPAPVILIDVDDEHFLRERRWRAFPAPRGHRVKWHLRGGTRGHAIQRLIFPKAEAISFYSTDAFDLRRCNIRCTSLRVLLPERNARRGWKDDSPGAARANAWKKKKRAEKKAQTAA
jgi:hypothetical protein